MRKITQTIVGTTPPLDKNVLWLDTTNSNSPVEKVFLNGAWIPTSAAGGDYYTKDEVDENFMGKIDNPHVGNILVMDENGKAVDSLTKPANFISNPEGGKEHAVLSLDSHGNPVWTPLTPGGDTIESEMKDDSDKAVQNGVIKKYVDNNCARKDGYYSQMTVGSAENLVGQTVNSKAYLIRPTGGESNEVANGVASVLGMEGHSEKFNQLIQNGNFADGATGWIVYGSATVSVQDGILSVTANAANAGVQTLISVPQNHKAYIAYNIKGDIASSCMLYTGANYIMFGIPITTTWRRISHIASPIWGNSLIWRFNSGYTAQLKNVILIDLTAIFGAGNEPSTVAEFEIWLAQTVGTKPCYAYNAGEILSAQTLGINTYGQNLLNPTTKKARLIPYEWGKNSNVYTIKNVPSANDLQITYTPDATGVAVTIDITESIPDSIDIADYGGSGVLYISSTTADTYVCMKWDEQKDDDVVPYEDHTYDFDVRKVYGKVNGAGEYVQCFPNGIRGIGDVKDTLTASEAVVRIGSGNLGSLDWTYISGNLFPLSSQGLPVGAKNTTFSTANVICEKYMLSNAQPVLDKSITIDTNAVRVKDSAYTDAATFKTAMNGVMLNYELATPITYTDLIYRDNGIDTHLSDVLFNIEVDNWSIEEQLLTPYDENGNPTSIPATIKTQYGMNAVEAIDTLQNTCYFADDVKANLQALLTCINTNCSETLGGTFSVSDTATKKVFEFTFTPNTEPDVEPTNEEE